MATDSKEQLSSQPHLETTEKNSSHKSELAESKNIQKGASDVLGSADSNESQEAGENADGRVSETAGEDKSKASQGGGKKQYTDDEIEAIRAKLLASAPPQETMVREIKRKLLKQEHQLEKEYKKLFNKAQKNPYQFAEVVRKIRKIKVYFSVIARATYEMVKHLWLKIVHGV
ncbi:hypothetical protein KBD59_04345 [Candidatus Gracilibacteria bacterium]|nr:hypothetical protein [Candidatus Gracilibacteria bacterium]